MYEQRGVADVEVEGTFTLAVPTSAPLKASVPARLLSFSTLRDIANVGVSSWWRIVRSKWNKNLSFEAFNNHEYANWVSRRKCPASS